MGFIRNLGKNKKDKEKNLTKKTVKKATMALIIAILKKIALGSILLIAIGGFFSYLIESITSEETPKTIYEELEIENIKELVKIKGDNQNRLSLRVCRRY